MKVYHEIQPDALEAALINGLIRASRGDKGADKAIIKTDQFLDAHCPRRLKDQAVSRDDNLYAYAHVDGSVIDITDGRHVPIGQFVAASSQRVLELDVDPEKCFVSDLDTYDALKAAIEAHRDQSVLDRLAKSYWNKVVKLSGFDPAVIRRPEIMITYDVQPDSIRTIIERDV